jgi:hypothetical protein
MPIRIQRKRSESCSTIESCHTDAITNWSGFAEMTGHGRNVIQKRLIERGVCVMRATTAGYMRIATATELNDYGLEVIGATDTRRRRNNASVLIIFASDTG